MRKSAHGTSASSLSLLLRRTQRDSCSKGCNVVILRLLRAAAVAVQNIDTEKKNKRTSWTAVVHASLHLTSDLSFIHSPASQTPSRYCHGSVRLLAQVRPVCQSYASRCQLDAGQIDLTRTIDCGLIYRRALKQAGNVRSERKKSRWYTCSACAMMGSSCA